MGRGERFRLAVVGAVLVSALVSSVWARDEALPLAPAGSGSGRQKGGAPQLLPPIQMQLNLAARAGDAARIKALLKEGADVNARDSGGFTPLVDALMSGNADAVAALLGAHPDLGAEDANGFTPLMWAPNAKMAKLLLDVGADPNAAANDGTTALHLAALSGRMDVVQALVEHGSHVDARDKGGRTPAFLAAMRGNTEVLDYLLAHGAHMGFFVACAAGRVERVATEIAREKAVVGYRTKNWMTPLHFAAINGQPKVAALLLANGADVNALDISRETPLYDAATSGNAAVVRVLLKHGADAKERGPGNTTPLQIAAGAGNVPVAECLLDAGADIEARDHSGDTALYVAAMRGQTAMVKLLLDHGAKIEAAERGDGSTPLLAAVRNSGHAHWDYRPTVTLLLKRGASVNASDNFGRSPLYLAAESGSKPMVELLLKYGANRSAGGRDAAAVAQDMGHPEVARLIRDSAAPQLTSPR